VILLDTSGIISALFADQNRHQACARAIREARPPRIITPFVLAEVDYLIQKFAGVATEIEFLREIADGAYELARFDESDIRQCMRIIEDYKDLNIGLADASIVRWAERFDITDVVTLDERHFRAIRIGRRRRLRLLPADA
jgi:predicted nucleic acid-binding protein